MTWWAITLFMQGTILAFTFFRFVDGYVTFFPVDPWALGAVTATVISVLFRSRASWVFLATSAFMNFMYTLDLERSHPGMGLLVSLPMAAYSFAATVPTRIAVLGVIAVDLLLVLTAFIDRGVGPLNVFPLSVTAGLAASLAVGQMTFMHRRLVEESLRRADEAERTREAVAATRVAEERLSTARDLHDLVGHQIAVINLQAGAATRAIPEDPQSAAASLAVIEKSAERILREISGLLHDLRSEPSRATGGASLRDLSHTLTSAGFPLEFRMDAGLPPLPPAVDSAVYRILEESLVNAYKHGDAGSPARAVVGWDGSSVTITVTNAVGDAASPASAGLGLLGISERCQSLGGTMTSSVHEGVFTLDVHIPVSA